MFIDDVVLAGVLTVGLMMGFLGVFVFIAYKGMKRK